MAIGMVIKNEVSFMDWFTEAPTEPGWYWAMREGEKEADLVEVIKLENDYMTTGLGPMFIFTHWLGPLPMPEPPKE